jgi:hypothetical protein
MYSVTMAFSHFNNADASGSTFNNVGRDQFNNNFGIVINNINIPLPSSLHHHRRLTSGTGTLPQSVLIPKYHASSIVSVAGIAVHLIVNIINLLRIESSDECRELERELKSLCQSLNLTGLAIRAYEYTPLGQSLAKTIHPEVERCRGILQEMLDKIIHYRESLKSTSISGLWRQVWWNGWDVDELASSRMELSGHKESLNKFLMALES